MPISLAVIWCKQSGKSLAYSKVILYFIPKHKVEFDKKLMPSVTLFDSSILKNFKMC